MKILLTLCIGLASACTALAQKQIDAKSEIVSATVYVTGAELTRKANVPLGSGTTTVVFTNLPPNLNPQTVHVTAEGKLMVQSTQYKQNHLRPAESTRETKLWQDSLTAIERQLVLIADRKDLLATESELLDQNRAAILADKKLSVQTVQEFHQYYMTAKTENKRKWRGEETDEARLNEIKARLQLQLANHNSKHTPPDGQVHVTVYAENPVTAKFDINYVVNDAGWTPAYDLRADNVNAPVQLTYKASLWQKTNEDWKNIKLKLSTGNITVRNASPVFVPWSLDYYYSGAINSLSVQPAMKEMDAFKPNTLSSKEDRASTGADYTVMNNNQLAVVFDITVSYTIPTDGQPHSVVIQEHKLPTQYEYYTMPRIDPDVFLTARIADWEKLNLIAGTANVFFQNAYVGQTVIDPNSALDTLGISLGRDKKIIVKRTKVLDDTKSRIVGTMYRQEVAYDIQVKNARTEAVTVKVIDQFPVSRNGEIEITLEESGGASVEDETGKLTWMVTLPPNNEQKLRYGFSVKYPEKNRGSAPRL